MQITTMLLHLQRHLNKDGRKPLVRFHANGRVTLVYGWLRREETSQAAIALEMKIHNSGRSR